MKKLIAVAISNITYLRAMFPENSYANRSLDGLPLKILRENSNTPAAASLVGWLQGAFDAMEKGYLREMMLMIYLDKEKQDEIYEMYTFKFRYGGDNRAHCQVLQDGKEFAKSPVTDDQLYNSTQAMLRAIIVIVQGNLNLGIFQSYPFLSITEL